MKDRTRVRIMLFKDLMTCREVMNLDVYLVFIGMQISSCKTTKPHSIYIYVHGYI